MPLLISILAVIFLVMARIMGPAVADTTAYMKTFTSIDKSFWYISNGWANGDYQSCEWREGAIAVSGGFLHMTLSDHGGIQRPIGCAEIRTNQRPGYGLYEARMRAAAGSGLNTAFFTYVGPPQGVPQWDEIDFEFLGKDTHSVQTNFYTDGKSQGGVVVPLGYDASAEFHNYAIDWRPTKIRWYVDGKLVHESPDGAPIPSHPGSLFFSLWSGAQQEDAWLGAFHYTQPATADVEWTAFTPIGNKCLFAQSMSCK
jgi:endo-1,3-1,4-beta-glycanase ExoK